MPKIGVEAKEERRQELLDAAWACVARGGYHNLTIDDVCAEAGLSKGAFYTYFKTKRDLLIALLDQDAASMEGLITDVGQSHGSGMERIRRYLRAVLERGENRAVVQMRADLWAEVRDDADIQQRFAETVRRRRVLLKGWIDDATRSGELVEIPANAFASVLLALADGLMLHTSIDPGWFRWRNIRTALDALLDGIAGDGGNGDQGGAGGGDRDQ
ncbi:MAG: TetR/AcrR family transcriptional regulator [Acidimicrobiales bacterium]